MGESLMVVVYLLLGLGVVGALYYAVTQITVRQRKLDADMTRLERLAAEVAMNAEAILERVDERIEQLERLSAELEARAARVQAPPAAPPAEAAPAKPRRSRSRQSAAEPQPGADAGARPGPASDAYSHVDQAPSPHEQPQPDSDSDSQPKLNYAEIRARVYAMADAGHDALDIAQALGIPRGEVQLILNLRGAKMNA